MLRELVQWTLFLGDCLRELYRLLGLPMRGNHWDVDLAALRLLPKEEARRKVLTRYKLASFQHKLVAPRQSPELEREFRRLGPRVLDDLVEEPVEPEAHEFHYDDGTVDVIYW